MDSKMKSMNQSFKADSILTDLRRMKIRAMVKFSLTIENWFAV